jgi:hypothetical protein
MKIQDLTDCKEIDMTAVHGGHNVQMTVDTFANLVNEGKLTNPYDLIAAASNVTLDPGPWPHPA